jgi:hypothetical protein
MLNWYKKQRVTIRGAIIGGAFALAASVIVGAFELLKPNPTVVIYLPTSSAVELTSNPTPTIIPPDTPIPTFTFVPDSTPTDREIIISVIRAYYDNIPNDRASDNNIYPDAAWEVLTPSLQKTFIDREYWWNSVSPYRYIVNLDDPSFYQSIIIEAPDAKADIYREIRVGATGEIYSRNERITICFRREGGQWLISHINNGVITLYKCVNFQK